MCVYSKSMMALTSSGSLVMSVGVMWLSRLMVGTCYCVLGGNVWRVRCPLYLYVEPSGGTWRRWFLARRRPIDYWSGTHRLCRGFSRKIFLQRSCTVPRHRVTAVRQALATPSPVTVICDVGERCRAALSRYVVVGWLSPIEGRSTTMGMTHDLENSSIVDHRRPNIADVGY